MLNDRLEKDEIIRQLHSLKDAGLGAAIIRTFNGLQTDYLGEEWMSILKIITETAKKIGLKIYFQAGYMPAAIPEDKLPEKYKYTALWYQEEDNDMENKNIIESDDDYLYYEKKYDNVIDLLNPSAIKYYLKKSYEDIYLDDFAKEFGETITAIWVDEPHFKPPSLPWGKILKEKFQNKWNYSLEDNISLLFQNRDGYQKVRYHYWRTVVEMLKEGYFEPVSRWCDRNQVKFAGHLMGEDNLVSQIGFSGAAMPFYEKMHIPGIDHLTMSLTWGHGDNSGIDHEKFIMTPKQASSVAHQLHREEVLAEMYGVSSEGISFSDRKWLWNWFSVLGINHKCLHGSFYSLKGRRKRIYPPHLSYQQPWWQYNNSFADYTSRISYALRQGEFEAEALILHPVESAFCNFDPVNTDVKNYPRAPAPLRDINKSLSDLSENLMKNHCSFDYGDESLMEKYGQVEGKLLEIGEMSYKVVILPEVDTLRSETISLLNKFMDKGGKVIAVDSLPTRIDGKKDEKITTFKHKLISIPNTKKALKAILTSIITPELQLEAVEGCTDNIWLHKRKLNEQKMIYMVNISRDQEVTFNLRIKGKKKIEEWNLETGRMISDLNCIQKGENTELNLNISPESSRLLLVKETEKEQEVKKTLDNINIRKSLVMDGNWKIECKNPNVLTLDYCRVKKGKGEYSEKIPVRAAQELLEGENYQGPITLKFDFESEIKPDKIKLAVEELNAYSVKINETRVDFTETDYYLDKSFRTIDIARYVQEGKNIIELTREYQPLHKPEAQLLRLFEKVKGVELEQVYITGNFAVAGEVSKIQNDSRCIRFNQK
ncbi:MAG: glycosyl hydrolase, partial [bacterium]